MEQLISIKKAERNLYNRYLTFRRMEEKVIIKEISVDESQDTPVSGHDESKPGVFETMKSAEVNFQDLFNEVKQVTQRLIDQLLDINEKSIESIFMKELIECLTG